MNHLTVLDEALENSITSYHEFMLNSKANTLHVFVEGVNDSSFYRKSLEPYFEMFENHWFYPCCSKCQVFQTRNEIVERPRVPHWWNTMGVVYFVDKDFSDLVNTNCPPASDVFVTDYYSVENYLVSVKMLRTILTDFLNFSRQNTTGSRTICRAI